jgi:hypothetical protein
MPKLIVRIVDCDHLALSRCNKLLVEVLLGKLLELPYSRLLRSSGAPVSRPFRCMLDRFDFELESSSPNRKLRQFKFPKPLAQQSEHDDTIQVLDARN